jgi:hypothetical protein
LLLVDRRLGVVAPHEEKPVRYQLRARVGDVDLPRRPRDDQVGKADRPSRGADGNDGTSAAHSDQNRVAYETVRQAMHRRDHGHLRE